MIKNHDGDGKNCRLNDSMEVIEAILRSDTDEFLETGYIVPAVVLRITLSVYVKTNRNGNNTSSDLKAHAAAGSS
jgi:hypothetical protein